MSLADAQARVVALLTPVVGIATFYDRPPQAAPEAAVLPAAYCVPQPFTVTYPGTDLRSVRWAWETVILVARTDDVSTDYQALEPLIERCIAALEANTSFGLKRYYDAKITGGSIGPATFGDANYLGLYLDASVKEKKAVSIN